MHPDLQRLLDLQVKDLALLGTDTRIKALDEEIAALDAALDRARSDVEVTRHRLDEGIKRREELEKVIEAQRTQQEKRRTRIEQVKTAR
jgi:predicted  nucleic acid-binding Zn-ribbon protein